MGKGGELNLRYRPGGHETRVEDIEAYVDWLDSVFGRREYELPEAAIFPSYGAWLKFSDELVDPGAFPTNGLGDLLAGQAEGVAIKTGAEWEKKRAAIRERISWGLGQAPDYAESQPGAYGAEVSHVATLLGRAAVPAGLAKRSVNFGNYVAGDLWFPTNTDKVEKKSPVVIWLHPISVSGGYCAGYRRGEQPHIALAKMGCAVFAFDQLGNGTRLQEIRNFYRRYPHWSVLGKHVEDTLAAVEALRQVDFIDPKRIFVLGYGTGGMTALHAAALEDRIAGAVSVGGFTPMRLDKPAKGTGGVARWAIWLPLQPRLGAFVHHEAQIPYDYHEVLGMIAPRPALVCTPRIDWRTTPADVKACVADAARVYELLDAKDALQFEEVDDYNHFSPETQKVVFEKFKAMAGW